MSKITDITPEKELNKKESEYLRSSFPAHIVSSAQINSLKKKKGQASYQAQFKTLGIRMLSKLREQ